MNQQFMLTMADLSIDLVGAIFFMTAVVYSLHYLRENHLTTEGKIKYIFIIAISCLHLFQVAVQVLTGHNGPIRVWDITNYLTAVLLLMVVHRMAKKEQVCD